MSETMQLAYADQGEDFVNGWDYIRYEDTQMLTDQVRAHPDAVKHLWM